MKFSLERHLSQMLALSIVLVGCLAGIISFQLAYMEAQEFQDDTLQQIAAFASTTGLPHRKNLVPNVTEFSDIDPEMMIKLINLSANTTHSGLSPALSPGFHTVDRPDGAWRVFVRQTSAGYCIAAAQATEARDEIAIHSALQTLLPLLVLLPLLGWLAIRIVRRGFTPLHQLIDTLEVQATEQPACLPDTALPKEIAPFVQAINRQMERIKRLMEQQQRFIADAAHELRTPLTALSLQAQNLQQAENIEDMHRRILPLRAGIDRARRLTEQLLSLAKTQAGPAKLESVDMSHWTRDLLAGFLPAAEAKGLDLGLEDPGGIVLCTEPDTLALIVRNALDNAVRYTPVGGSITLRIHPSGQDCVVEVIDTGPGIPIQLRERIFAPFYRIEGTEGDGSGLGLAIARDAAIRLNSTISLHEGSGGSGLIFRVRLSTHRTAC